MKVIVSQITRQQGDQFDDILVVGETKSGDITATFQITQKVKAGDPLPSDLEQLMASRAHQLLAG